MQKDSPIKLSRKAYAKINLGLDVVGKLPNGYHELRSIMQQIDLYDVLTVEKIPKGIVLTSNVETVPLNEKNLAYKGAKAVLDAAGMQGGIQIHIEKNIPVEAGMAGGSTDGAMAMILTNELYGAGLTEACLCEIGAKLGADIPFCIKGHTQLCEGIGELMTPVALQSPLYYCIVKPPEGVSTKYVFEQLDSKEYAHPDTEGILRALQDGDKKELDGLLLNVLAEVTEKEKPEIVAVRQKLKACGAVATLMSGSGPTVFGIFETLEGAVQAAKEMKERYPAMFSGAYQSIL